MAELTRTIRGEHRDHAFTMMGEAVTYRVRSDTLNRQTGAVTESNTDTSVSEVLVSELDPMTIAESGGRYKIGARLVRIRESDLPASPPNLQTHQIVFESDSYVIEDATRSGDNNVWDLMCNRA